MKKPKSITDRSIWKRIFISPFVSLRERIDKLLARRPHRSFRRTRRRDYVRSLKLPGYWAFTNQVFGFIWQGRRHLLLATLIYSAFTTLVVGWASQDTYAEVGEILRGTSSELIEGGIGMIGEAGVLLGSTVTSNLNGAATPQAQAYAVLIIMFFWLLLVWILRSQLAGRQIKLRDALYNSGAPVISTLLVGLVLFIQLIPVAVAVVAYSAGVGVGMLNGGVEAMLVWLAIILLGVLSLYWSISTVLALVVVTLPGMYPMQAIRTAGDLVVGRRIRIFLRLIWMLLVVAVLWAIIMIPIIILDHVAKESWGVIEWLPVVPMMLLVMTSLTILFAATYIYLLYRKIVNDDAKPA